MFWINTTVLYCVPPLSGVICTVAPKVASITDSTVLCFQDLHQYLVKLLSEVEPIVKRCDISTGHIRTYAKSLYQNLWNASLTLTNPIMALTLQQFSLQYQLASGAPMGVVCSQAFKILLSSQESTKSVENIDTFRLHLRILDSIIQVAQKETALSDEVVLHIHRQAMEFAKMLLRLKECASYRKISKDVTTLCEKRTDEQILHTLKIGLKLAECAMAFKVGWCEGDKMKKMVSTSNSVLKTMTKGVTHKVLTVNTIAVRSLLTMLAIFRIEQEQEVEVGRIFVFLRLFIYVFVFPPVVLSSSYPLCLVNTLADDEA